MADQSNMTVSLTIKVQGKEAQAELAKTNAQLKATGAELGKVTTQNKQAVASTAGLASGFKDLALSIAGVVTAGKAFAFFRQTVNELDELRDMSLKTGIAIGKLDALDHIAKKTGSSGAAISGAFRFINKALEEASQGSEDANRAFSKLGTTWQEFYKLSEVDRLYAIIEGLEKLGTGATGAKTAQTLLGRSYQELIPLIKDVGSGLRGQVEELEKARPEIVAVSDAADRANDILADMGRELKLMVNEETIQGFEALAKSAVWAIKEMAAFGDKLGGMAAWVAERSRWGAIGKQVLADEAGTGGGGLGGGEGYGWGEEAGQSPFTGPARPGIPQEIMDANRRLEEIAALEREALDTKNAELAKKAAEARAKEQEAILDWVKQVEDAREALTIDGLARLRDRRIEDAQKAGLDDIEMMRVVQAAFEEFEDAKAEIIKRRTDLEEKALEKVNAQMEKNAKDFIEAEEEKIRILEYQSEVAAQLNAELDPPGGFFGGMKSGLGEFRRSVGSDFEQGKRAMLAGLDSITSHSEEAFANFINGSQSASEAFRNFAASVLQDIARMIIRMQVLAVAEQAIGLINFGGGPANPLGPNGEIGSGVPNDRGQGTPGNFFGGNGASLAMSPGGGATGGTVIVNNYSVNAVDQASVAKLFASPEFQRAQRGQQIKNEKFNTATRASRR